MKYILILMLSLYSVGAASQARLGVPITAVKAEMKALDLNLLQARDSVYVLETKDAHVKYICDATDIVVTTVIYPRTQKSEAVYNAYYNKNMRVISKSMWRYYQGGDSCYIIRVRKGDLQGSYFIWTYELNKKPVYDKIY